MPMTALNAYAGNYELEFERPLIALERQINDLEHQHLDTGSLGSPPAGSPSKPAIDFRADIRKLRQSHTAMLKKIYASLSPWNTVQVGRHPGRPQTIDYINTFVKDFTELHGDRHQGDDKAIITGFGRIGPHKCLVVGHHKGKDTKQKIAANFGCAHPEGYRKAMRLMRLADRAGLPIVCFIDTAGAYPGVASEERHVAEAIAVNMRDMFELSVPIVALVLGEGGSGGAIGIGVADRVLIMENAYYAVISPEGCAAILWKDRAAAPKAAEAMKMTAPDLMDLGLVDGVVKEPVGGAQYDWDAAASAVKDALLAHLGELRQMRPAELRDQRYAKFRSYGVFAEA